MATFEDYLFTKNTKWVLWGAVAFILALLIFLAGMAVGERRFMRPPQGGGPGRGFLPNGFMVKGHGAVGTIESLTLPVMTLKTREGFEENVEVGSTSVVVNDAGQQIPAGDLSPGETVIVIGDPSDADAQSDIDARFIHVLPPPPGI